MPNINHTTKLVFIIVASVLSVTLFVVLSSRLSNTTLATAYMVTVPKNENTNTDSLKFVTEGTVSLTKSDIFQEYLAQDLTVHNIAFTKRQRENVKIQYKEGNIITVRAYGETSEHTSKFATSAAYATLRMLDTHYNTNNSYTLSVIDATNTTEVPRGLIRNSILILISAIIGFIITGAVFSIMLSITTSTPKIKTRKNAYAPLDLQSSRQTDILHEDDDYMHDAYNYDEEYITEKEEDDVVMSQDAPPSNLPMVENDTKKLTTSEDIIKTKEKIEEEEKAKEKNNTKKIVQTEPTQEEIKRRLNELLKGTPPENL